MDRQAARTASDLERRHSFGKTFSEILGMIDDSREYVTSLESKLTNEIKTQSTSIKRNTEQIELAAEQTKELEDELGKTEEALRADLKITADGVAANVESITSISSDLSSASEIITTTAEVLNGEIKTAISSHEESLSNVDDRFKSVINDYESKISQTDKEFQIQFKETTSRLTGAEGEIEKTQTDLEKHFTFNQNGITITAGEGSMNLVLDNDVIRFEKDGVVFGTWDGVDFHTGNIVVDLNEKAQFGNFAFIPRSDGSLSFLKVGG